MKILSLIFLLLITSFKVVSQIESNKLIRNVIYVEGAGIGGYGSLNYERVFWRKSKILLCARVGLGSYNIKDYTNNFNPDIIMPMAINGFYGKNHKIELGIGQAISNIVYADYESNWNPSRETKWHANFTIGYRFQKDVGGIVFRINYSPIIEMQKQYRHWGGVSLGYSF